MAPKNNKLKEMELTYKIQYEELFRKRIGMVLQIGQDAGCFAANDVFHMGASRAPDYCIAYREYVNAIVKMIFEDQNDDAEFIYAKAKIDERLKKIVGEENFTPYDERYGLEKEGKKKCRKSEVKKFL